MYLAQLVLLGTLGGPPALVVRLSVDLVQVDAVVTDAKGRPITDLVAADFEILQDGRVQAVTQAVYMGGTTPPSLAGGTVASGTEAAPGEAPADALVFVVDDRALSVTSLDATRMVPFGDFTSKRKPVSVMSMDPGVTSAAPLMA